MHSGSRGYGYDIFNKFTQYMKSGIKIEDENFKIYMNFHDNANKYAKLNREIISRRITELLNINITNKI